MPQASSASKTSTDRLEAHNTPPAQSSSPVSKLIAHPSVAIIGLSILISGAAILFSHSASSPAAFQAGRAYALCSRQAKIYTVDDSNSKVECIVVNNSLILHSGSRASVKQLYGTVPFTTLPTHAIVVPGLSDSHGHLLEYGASKQLPLEGTSTINETVDRVRSYILSTPSLLEDRNAFIRGGGWDHTSWPGSAWPTADDLEADPVLRGRPIVLQSKDCHALWVSRRVLELSTSAKPFPASVDGGVVLRDERGEPTGMMLDNAQDLLNLPPLTEIDLQQRFRAAANDALRYGLTSVHDAGLDPASLDFFFRQAATGKLPIRVYAMRFFNETAEYWGNTTTQYFGGENRLTARSVKIFADGALRTGGSALYEPYTDNPSTPGFMRLPEDVFFDAIPRFLRDGWQVNVHAIGDRANGIVLDAFEASLQGVVGVNVTALRPRLEHAQLMTKEDMRRVGRLGVIASVQPTHVISDMWYAQDRLGPERIKGLYAFRSFIDAGARLTLSSDFPVETMNPLATFYAAITRTSIHGESPHGPGGWFPEERLTRVEALRGMTIDPAYASFTESTLGSLEPGKHADFTVLSRDIMQIPAKEILDVEVVATVIDGEVAFGQL